MTFHLFVSGCAWIVKCMQSTWISVVEPEPPGAATFRVEPEPIFYLTGSRAGAGAAFFKASMAPAASFWQEKKESLVLLPFLSGAVARVDPIWSEPESAPGPRTSGAGATKKNWRLCNTDLKCVNYCKTKTKYSVCITAYKKITFFKTPFVIYNSTIIISVLWELFKAYFL